MTAAELDEDYLAALAADEPATRTVSSWRPVDLTEALTDGYRPPTPTVGRRSDGRPVLYAGRTHTLSGESEGGKSWLAQLFAVQELNAGNGVVYVDFEDDGAAVAHRLLLLGTTKPAIRDRFAYLNPTEPITTPGAARDLLDAVRDVAAGYVVLDGVTEALSLHGLSTLDNDDLATFGRLVTRPLTALGAAVLSLDHVTKDRETRGRYAIGGVHKLNGLSGAALILENVDRFGDGLAGRSRLSIAKDRPGQLRPHALRGKGDLWWFGDFTLDTSRPIPDPAELRPPVERAENFRPTVLMSRVADALAGAPMPLSGADIEHRVTGKAADVRRALAALVDDSYVAVTDGPRGARLHTLTRPYEGDTT